MQKKKFIKQLSMILVLAISFGFAFPVFKFNATAQSTYDEAYEKTKLEFNSIKESSETAAKYLDAADNGLKNIEKRLNEILATKKANPKVKELKKKVLESRMTIKQYRAPLKTFNEYAESVTNVTETYEELKEIKQNFSQYRNNQGQLASNLYLISKGMEEFGEKVPLVGKAIEAYGKITGGLIEKINVVSKAIDENRNQGAISGQGFYKTGSNLEKYNILKNKYPYLAENVRYIPSRPSYVYEPDFGSEPYLIWNEETKEFYLVQRTVPLQKIFDMNMIVRGRPTPADMKVLCDGWETVGKKRSATAIAIMNLLKLLRSGTLSFKAYSDTNISYNGLLSRYLDSPEKFEAYYIFDNYFREGINRSLSSLYNKLDKDKNTKTIATRVKAVSENNGIPIVIAAPPVIAKKPEPKPQNPQNSNIIPINKQPVTQQPTKGLWDSLVDWYNSIPPANQTVVNNTPLPKKPAAQTPQPIKPAPGQNVQPVQKQEDPSYICSTYMQALTADVAAGSTSEHQKRVAITSGYTYKDGYCVGSHQIFQTYIDYNDGNKVKEQSVFSFYSPENPAQVSRSDIERWYKAKYPNLKW